MDPAVKPQTPNPLDGLYNFARAHLLVINAVVLASSTLVGLLDFLAPRLSVLPKVVYSATACIVMIMLASAIAPAAFSRFLALAGVTMRSPALGPLWRRPAWQITVTILLGVTVFGFASVAKASQGGLIASSFPAAKTFQDTLLTMSSNVGEIKGGVQEANKKLDKLVAVVDPANAANRCPDLECAVFNGADAAVVENLLAKGARLSGNTINDGALLLGAALSSSPDRLAVVDMLIKKGIDRDLLLLPTILDAGKLTEAGSYVAGQVLDAARWESNPIVKFIKIPSGDVRLDKWNEAAGCFLRTSGGVTLIEVGALLGDAALVDHLKDQGDSFPTRELACSWRGHGMAGYARVNFDLQTGKYMGASGR